MSVLFIIFVGIFVMVKIVELKFGVYDVSNVEDGIEESMEGMGVFLKVEWCGLFWVMVVVFGMVVVFVWIVMFGGWYCDLNVDGLLF